MKMKMKNVSGIDIIPLLAKFFARHEMDADGQWRSDLAAHLAAKGIKTETPPASTARDPRFMVMVGNYIVFLKSGKPEPHKPERYGIRSFKIK